MANPPYPSKLDTPWSAKVSKTLPWPEYPRPQLVRKQWQNLNGSWDYAVVPKGQQEAPRHWDGKILVPFCIESALSGVRRTVTPDDALWYQRRFVPSTLKSERQERQLLHFDAVDWEARVWVNGQEVGQHQGGYDPFTLDITEALRVGENTLTVRVYDPTRGFQPCGKQKLDPGGVMYTPVSGIWQTVWLESVPVRHLTAVRAETTPDRQALVFFVEGSEAATPYTLQLKDGRQTVVTATGKTGEPLTVRVPSPKLWSPGSPFLYNLTLTAAGGDRVESYAALRTVALGKDPQGYTRILLNGEPLFQYGPLDQGWWPDGLYTPPTDEALRFDIQAMKRLGFNMVRKHVKVEPARWYWHCDRAGLLVWQDMPNGWGISTEEARANFDTELKAMVDFSRPFPLVVLWTVFNEGWGQSNYGMERSRKLSEWLRSYDPTRLVSSGSGWFNVGGDQIDDIHCYPGPGIHPLTEGRAAVLGEFGGMRQATPGHSWKPENDKENTKFAGSLAKRYGELLDQVLLLREQGLAAAVYTQLTDVEIELNGFLTYDRRVNKLDGDVALKQQSTRLYAPGPSVTILAQLGPLGTTQKNISCIGPFPTQPQTVRFVWDGKTERVELWSWAILGASLSLTVNGQPVPELSGGAGEFYRSVNISRLLSVGENMLTVTATAKEASAMFEVRALAISESSGK
ncbi:sugar-binding domain-containing protein [Armatimonas sp.]|uniref:glycoside hydrolase family 2 protein n=1 Tax=Armatimonas sp. TaxID=1872638 RepID=UPI00286C68A9|nr:sugar-binding domain-containing protein [Armatimonas sp.]